MPRPPCSSVDAPRLRILLPFLLAIGSVGCGDLPRGEDPVVTRWGDDLLVAGQLPQIADSVPGDAILAVPDLHFTGSTGGDYLGAAGRQRIGGRIEGSVRAAAGDLAVVGQVGRNATMAGGRVEVLDGAVIQGNAYIAGGRILMAGAIGGHLRAAGGEVLVDGEVGGDLTVDAGQLRVGPGAHVTGDLTHRVPPGRVVIDPGAQIGGQVVALPPRAPPSVPGWWTLRILWGLGFLLAGTVLVSLLPRAFLGGAESLAHRPGVSTGFGLLWLVGVPLAVCVFLLTIIGLPFALLLGALFLTSLYVGRVVPALWIGQRILAGRTAPGTRWDPALADAPGPSWDEVPEPLLGGTEPRRAAAVGSFLLGGLILVLVGLIPTVGLLVALLATLVGIGALLVALRETMRQGRRSDAR